MRIRHWLAPPPPPPPPPQAEPITYGHFGDYSSWEEASAHADSGEEHEIVQTYVRWNRALVANPPTTLDSPHVRLLAALLLCVSENCRILDFGGGMGGSYLRVRRFLPQITWTVVDLPRMVDAATEFENEHIRFRKTIEPADIVIASGVLQLCREPYRTLAELVALKPSHLIIARTPLLARDRLMTHRVSPTLFPATLPTWLLGESRLHHETQKLGLKPVLRWDYPEYCLLVDDKPVEHFGCLYEVSDCST